jgi:pimeloyl-ACP methyl ester carboxylesterase
MADDITAFIRALGLKKVGAFGFSIGDMQVQELTLRHPELVRKQVLLGTGCRGMKLAEDPQFGKVAANPVPMAEDFLFLFFGPSEKAKQAGPDFWERRHLRPDQDPPEALDPVPRRINGNGGVASRSRPTTTALEESNGSPPRSSDLDRADHPASSVRACGG